jgi:hypothetical protein
LFSLEGATEIVTSEDGKADVPLGTLEPKRGLEALRRPGVSREGDVDH